ncbi:HtaA domain-containing protein [Agrococcus jejuensis]|uniref:Htaa protein n=1 Tax=Agrococcus jejuensis TaxID=399736 RepID=A0A1G8CE20_9MICO|nr:HtaA domain-containing protein [Agrococcus jejuensis]SDH43697.1 Htaa protein [Agrococcus jejuensis]
MPDSAPTPAPDAAATASASSASAATASIAPGSLVWRIKSSLIGYVRGMSDGEVLLDDGVLDTAEGFAFPAKGVDGDTLRFGGVVTFQGHNGMMHVELSEPSLTPVGDGWRVEFSDPDAPTVRLHFADVASVVTGRDGTQHGTGTFLAADGADLFFGPYEQGTPLDDPFVQG